MAPAAPNPSSHASQDLLDAETRRRTGPESRQQQDHRSGRIAGPNKAREKKLLMVLLSVNFVTACNSINLFASTFSVRANTKKIH